MVYLAEELVDAVSFLDCDRLPVARAVPVAVGNLHLQEVRKYIIQFSFTGGQQVHHPVFPLQESRKYIIQSSFISPSTA
jgi:hypothetical protein